MVTKSIDISTTNLNLEKLVSEMAHGVEIIFVDGNTPVARLMPVGETQSGRKPDLSKGAILTSDDFDEPLPDEFWLGEE